MLSISMLVKLDKYSKEICMVAVSRLSDIGTGTCKAGHPDVPVGSPKDYAVSYISGAQSVFVNNLPMLIIGSQGTTDCGHTTTAISGSDTEFAEYLAIHRIGDIGIINEGDGEHIVVTGSSDVDN